MNFGIRTTRLLLLLVALWAWQPSAFAQGTNDAGVIALVQPANPFNGTGLQQIQVRIKNFGNNTLLSTRIEWEYEGVAQPFVLYPGLPLAPGAEADVVMGNVNMSAGNTYRFRFWTAQPNNASDSNNANDTLDVTVCRALSGTFTVGTPTSDYPTLSAAVNALYSCSIDGPITFLLAPGVYSGNLTLTPIPGASAVNTVTFDGGDTTTTTLTHTGLGSNGRAVVRLNGAKHVRLRNFRIVNTGTTNAYGIHLMNQADSNVIENNCIVVHWSSGIAEVVGILASNSTTDMFAEGNNANWNTIQNNIISGGRESIHLEGLNLQENQGNRILNNRMFGADIAGVNADDQSFIEISGNRIFGLRNATTADGLNLFDLMNYTITANNIAAPDFALSINDGNFDGTPISRGLIANNMLISATTTGMYLFRVVNTDIWHNSAVGVRGVFFSGQANNDFRNNIAVGSTGFALETATNAAMPTMNHNLYHKTAAGNLLKYGTPNYATLAAWQPVLGYDANSVSGNPGFVSIANDLHVLGTLANDAGIAVGIATDIDGQMRPMGVTVDIGADEYTPYTTDARALQLVQPLVNSCGNASHLVRVIVSNLGTSPITSMNVVAEVSGAVTTTLSGTYTGNIAPNGQDTVNLGTLNTFNGGFFIFKIYTQLAGEQNPSNDTLNVTVGITPSSPLQAVHDTVCVGLPAVLTTQPAPGAVLNWFNVPTGGSPIATGNNYTIPSLVTNQTFYVEPQSQTPGNLLTTTAAGNGQNGSMFDITALTTVTITGFEGYAVNSGTFNYQVYYKTGTCIGFATNAAAWTLLGSASVPVTANVLHTIPIAINVAIPAGQTAAFYVTTTASTIAYTNAPTLGGVYAANANIQFKSCYGNPYPFGSPFSPRAWNGRINYTSGGAACNATRVPVNAVVFNPTPLNLGADTSICQGTPLTLDAQIPNAQYFWSNNGAAQQVMVNSAGTYSVRVEDPYGCEYRDTIVVGVHPVPNLNLQAQNPSCNGDTDGQLSVNPTGGVGGFGYQWSGGQTASSINGLAPGSYSVTVNDQGTGCNYTASANLIDPTPIAATATGTDAPCAGNPGGSATALPAGGTLPYSYEWSNGATGQTASGLIEGTYTVTVTDASGCETTASYTVNGTPAVVVTLDSIQNESIDINGGIFISVSGGTAPYTVLWNNGSNSEDITGLVAAAYTVTVTDANGCAQTATFNVAYTAPTEVEELAGVRQIRLFPNPTQDVAYLQIELAQNQTVRVEILDMTGRLVERLAPQSDAVQHYTLDMRAYAGGVYVLRLHTQGEALSKRLILNK